MTRFSRIAFLSSVLIAGTVNAGEIGTFPGTGSIRTFNGGSGQIRVFPAPPIINQSFQHVLSQHTQYPAGTYYFPPSGYIFSKSNETVVQVPYRTAGTLSKLYVYVINNTLTGSSTITLRKNGVDTALTVTVGAGASGIFEDTTNTVTVAAGDKLSYKLVTSGSGTGLNVNTFAVLFKPTGNGAMMKYVLNGFPSETNWWPTFYNRPAWTGTFAYQTESPTFNMNRAGTFRNLAVYAENSANTGNTNIRLRKNLSDTSLAVAVPGGSTGLFENTANTVSVVYGDTVTIAMSATTPQDGNFNPSFVAMEFVPSDASLDYHIGISQYTVGAGATQYSGVLGTAGIDSVAATYAIPSRIKATLSKLRWYVTANTISSSATVTLLKNGSPTSLAVTVTSGQTGIRESDSTTVDVVETDYLAVRIQGASGTGSVIYDWISVGVLNTD